MIKKFNGYDEVQVYDGTKSLAPGGYVCIVKNVRVETYSSCSILKLAIDIDEGEEKGYYAKKFDNAKASNPNAKWGGTFDVFLPKDDGSEKDGYTKQAFKRFVTSVEKSNSGYTWNWDENSLIGKRFGGVFGREQFQANDGSLKFATKCRFANSVDTIRNGKFKVPDDKLLKGYNGGHPAPPPVYNAPSANSHANLNDFEETLSDGEIPF